MKALKIMALALITTSMMLTSTASAATTRKTSRNTRTTRTTSATTTVRAYWCDGTVITDEEVPL